MDTRKDIKSIRQRGCLFSPRIIQIEITNACPFNCPQCYKPDIKHAGYMDLNHFKKHVNDAEKAGTKAVVLIGGEPMIHKDITSMLSALKCKNLEAAMYTSGWGINKDNISVMKEMGDSLYLFLSINGSTDEINNKSREGFYVSMAAARLLKEERCNFGINWVARHDNISNLPEMIKLSFKIGATFLNIVCNKITGSGTVESPITKEDHEKLVKIVKENKGFVKIQKCYDTLILESVINKRSILSGCQAGISICSIKGDGSYVPCLHLNYPEKFNSLMDYWNNSSILKKLRNRGNPKDGICKDCKYFEGCRFCRAMSLKTHDAFSAGLEECVVKKVRT